jgi:hypothetical protein
MSEIRDGFFHHPHGNAPATQLQRLLNGEHNTAYDSLFSTTISEVDGGIREAELLRQQLLSQLLDLRKKLLSLREHKNEIEEAVQSFEETGEIAPVLIPACDAMVAKEQADLRKTDVPKKATEIHNAKADLKKKLPDEWGVVETNADDEFVYITIKRRRAVVAAERPSNDETRARIIGRVQKAFETYGRDFSSRARPLRLMAVPANPRASP